MIEVQELTKHYGGRPAIVDLSFTVPPGQALGLIGPESAGKSTALRILAGCLDATSGTASIAGYDLRTRPREARRHLGYLPPGAPLYGEMRVEGCLDTMCRLRGVRPAARRERIGGALETCGLTGHRREIAGRLSPALRRRLALAQAVVHEPGALVLDEPAAGLDAAEGSEIRDLVARLARGRAVVVSGRIRSDVSALCGRVLALERGRLVPDEASERPRKRPTREVVAVVRGDAAELERHVRQLDGVVAVTLTDAGGGDHRITATGDREDLQDAVARVIVERGFGLKELRSGG